MPDLKFALRQLFKSPRFTTIAVVTLALAIGAATALFSSVHGVLLRPLPFPDADRLVTVRSWIDGRGAQDFPYAFNVSAPDYQDWAAENRSFAHLAAALYQKAALLGGDTPRQLTVLGITGNFFDVFRVPLLLGRTFTAAEIGAVDGSRVILSHGFWNEAFGADPGVVGRTLQLETGPCTIIGVAGPALEFRQDVRPHIYRLVDLRPLHRGDRMLWTYGRLKPDVTLAQAEAELSTLAARLKAAHPDTNAIWGVRVWPLQEVLTRAVKRPLLLLSSAAAAILVLACVNLATLLLVRAAGRQQEMAIRAALGASRLTLVRQLLTENLLLALVGGACGTLLARSGLGLVTALTRLLGAGSIEGATELSLSWPVLAFAVIGTCGATLLFGAYPALHLARTQLESALRSGSRGLTATRTRQRVLRGLVVAQVAFAFVLLVSASLFARSLSRLRQASPGFDTDQVLAVELTRPDATWRQSVEQRAAFADAVIAQLNMLPGVTGAAAVNVLPFTGENHAQRFAIQGRAPAPGIFMAAELRMVSPSYHRVLGLPLLRGRGLAETDIGRPAVVVVDQTFARRFFGDDDPIGQTLLILDQPHEIVGVSGSVKHQGLAETQQLPHVYVPLTQRCGTRFGFLVRTAQSPSLLAQAIPAAVAAVDPQQPVQRIAVMHDLATRTIAPQRLSATLLSLFAGFALALSALGVYGVIAFSVAQRTRELAIRMTFGAARADLFKNVLWRGAGLVALGLGLGVAGVFALRRVLAAFLFELSPFDPVSVAVGVATFAGVALLACWLPARRAMRVDPAEALRAE